MRMRGERTAGRPEVRNHKFGFYLKYNEKVTEDFYSWKGHNLDF